MNDSICVKDICFGLIDQTTCNGLPHIYFSKGIAKKICWSFITLVATLGLIFNLFNLSRCYTSFSVSVVMEMQRKNQMIFPAATVCNISPIKNISEEMMRRKRSQDPISKKHNISKRSTLSRNDLGLYESVLDCMFEGTDCRNKRNFKMIVNEIYGDCYTFNAGWDSNFLPIKSLKAGRRHGLQMILTVNQLNYITRTNDVYGVRLVVHSPYSLPFPEDDGIVLKPGQSTSLGIREVSTEKKGSPYGNCFDENELQTENVYEKLYKGVRYTKKACMKTCYQRSVIQNCGCGDRHYPLLGYAFQKDQEASVAPCSSLNERNCVKEINRMINNKSIECNCHEACRDITYSLTKTIGTWPAKTQQVLLLEQVLKKFPKRNSEELRYAMMKVEIYFEDFSFDVVKEIPEYEVSTHLYYFYLSWHNSARTAVVFLVSG